MTPRLNVKKPVQASAKSFRDLRVWRSAIALVREVYRATEDFPGSELYGLTRQMRRAAVSIPSNIAEGYAREHRREYLQFLAIAQGSLAELETRIEISLQLDYLSSNQLMSISRAAESLAKQLRALRRSLR